MMTFEAPAAQFVADEDFCFQTAARAPLPLASDPAPEWAMRNPARMMAFLYVSPRDCAALDTMFAA